MDPFESAWESWIRPLLVVALVVGLGVAWWAGWLPDAALGWPLLVGLVLVSGALAVREHWRPRDKGRLLAAALALAAVAVAAWGPAAMLSDRGRLAAGDLSGPSARLSVPPRGAARERVVVYVHGEPAGERAQVTVSLDTPGPEGATQHFEHKGELVDRLVGGRGGAKAVRNTEIVWPVRADLGRGAALAVSSERADAVDWPVHVEVREAPPAGKGFMIAAGLLALFAAVVDARRRPRGAALTWIAFGSGVFSAAFAYWYAPGLMVKTVFGAALAAMVGGLVVSWPIVGLLRRRLRPQATVKAAA